MEYIATIGTFDGLHVGHRTLFRELCRVGDTCGLASMAVTFDRHPLSVIAPRAVPPLLDDNDTRLRRLAESGLVDRVEVITFDSAERAKTALQFMQDLHGLGVRKLVMGHDNTFGSDRLRGIEAYAEVGRQVGVEVIPLQPVVTVGDTAVSSSAIRAALAAGDIDTANAMLGRPYTLTGPVAHGRGEGRGLGFATANIDVPAARCIPAPGVYACRALGHPAMVNIGVCPTFTDGRRMTVEAHLIGYDGDLYGQPLTLEFVRRLRDERRFAGPDEFRAQLSRDLAATLQLTS